MNFKFIMWSFVIITILLIAVMEYLSNGLLLRFILN